MPANMKKKRKKRDAPSLLRGKYSTTRTGAGFVSLSDGSGEIFIPPKGRGGAVDGDEVTLALLEERSGIGEKHAGRITGILERPRKILMAQLAGKRLARPMNPHLPEEVRVGGKLPGNADAGDWVKMKLLDTGRKRTALLHAEVLECCGRTGNPEDDLAAIAAEYQLEKHYTPHQDAAAGRLKPRPVDRIDLRKFFTFTIDPEDAHDFDDAISVSPGKNEKETLLGVHIADAAAYIVPGTSLDKEARKRGFSAYIPGLYLPMLPPSLLKKICLREGVDSFAHSILFTVRNRDGAILSAERLHTLIRVERRLNYTTVQRFLDNQKDPALAWTPEFRFGMRKFVAVVRKMHSRRKREEQFLNPVIPEIRAVYDEVRKKAVSIEYRKPCPADSLVEECMLAANSFVAKELLTRKIPGMFRVHPEPDPEKIAYFNSLCRDFFRFSPGDILSSREAALQFLKKVPSGPRGDAILSLFLRSLPRASYQAEAAPHYGLGKEEYTHFTSPVRRYPDLLIHQQLWEADRNGPLKSRKIMEKLAKNCSLMEENTDNAFFAANDRLKLHYLKDCGTSGSEPLYEAVILKVNTSGLFCRIEKLGIGGFVPRENLPGGRVHGFIGTPQKMISSHGHPVYRPGDFIYLLLDSVDIVRGNAIFRPVI